MPGIVIRESKARVSRLTIENVKRVLAA